MRQHTHRHTHYEKKNERINFESIRFFSFDWLAACIQSIFVSFFSSRNNTFHQYFVTDKSIEQLLFNQLSKQYAYQTIAKLLFLLQINDIFFCHESSIFGSRALSLSLLFEISKHKCFLSAILEMHFRQFNWFNK